MMIVLLCAVLPESKTAKLVGITFSTDMKWTAQLDKVVRSAKLALYRLTCAKAYLSPYDLATLYKSKVRSRMEYCSPLWAGAGSTALHRLDSVQRQAEKLIGLSLHLSQKLDSLSQRRGVSGVCLMHRLLHRTAPAAVLDLCPERARAPTRATRTTATKPIFFALPPANKPNFWTNSFVPYFSNVWNNLTPALQESLT
jgi:hypothetical protein